MSEDKSNPVIGNHQFMNLTSGPDRINLRKPEMRARLEEVAALIEEIQARTSHSFDRLITINGHHGFQMRPGINRNDAGALSIGTYGWSKGKVEAVEGIILHEMGHHVSNNTKYLQAITYNFAPLSTLDSLNHFMRTDPERAQGWIAERFGSATNALEYFKDFKPFADSLLTELQPIVGKTDVELFGILKNRPELFQDIAESMGTDSIMRLLTDEDKAFLAMYDDVSMQNPITRSMMLELQSLDPNSTMSIEEIAEFEALKPLRSFSGGLSSSEVRLLDDFLTPYQDMSELYGSLLKSAGRAEEYLADDYALRYARNPEAYFDFLREMKEPEQDQRRKFAEFKSKYGIDPSTHPLIDDRIAMGRQFLASPARMAQGTPGLSNYNVMPEPAVWLTDGLDFGSADDAHRGHWFGIQDEGTLDFVKAKDHDPVHALLALSGARTFQADLGAEAHVAAIQNALARTTAGVQNLEPQSLLTPKGYIKAVKDVSRATKGIENMHRTLLWVMGGQTQQSMEAVYRSYKHAAEILYDEAEKQGFQIIMDTPKKDALFGEMVWQIKTPEGVSYTYQYGDPPETSLPRGTNDVEVFREFKVPNDKDILDVFQRIFPVLQDLQPQILAISHESVPGATLRDLLGDIPVRVIYERMHGGTTPLTISPAARLRAERAVAEHLAKTPAISDVELVDGSGTEANRLAATIAEIDGHEGDARVAAKAGEQRVLATIPAGPHAAAERDLAKVMAEKIQTNIGTAAAAERGEKVKAAMHANGGTLPDSVAMPPKLKTPDESPVVRTPHPRAAEALPPVDSAVVGHDGENRAFREANDVPPQWRSFIERQEASATALGVNAHDARLASLELLRVGALHTRTYHGTAHFADVAGGVENWIGSELTRGNNNLAISAILSRVAQEYHVAGGTHDWMVLNADGTPNLETTGLGRYVEPAPDGNYSIRKGVAARDENLRLALAAYGYKEGDALNPFNGRNEFLTTLRTLDAQPGMDAQAKFSVALFHEQTIPFPAPDAVAQALERAKESGLFTAEEMAVRGRAMAHMANHDVANFTHAREAFRGNTLNLLLEVPEGDLGIPRLLATRAHDQATFFEGIAARIDRGEAVIFRSAPSMSKVELAEVTQKNARARAQITESIADMRALVAAADPELAREKGVVVDDAERARGAEIHAEAKARWQAHITHNPDRAPTLVATRGDDIAARGAEVLARQRIEAAAGTLHGAQMSGSGVFDRAPQADNFRDTIVHGNVTTVRPSGSGVRGTTEAASAPPRLPSLSDTGSTRASLAEGATNASPAAVANDTGHAAALNPRSQIKSEQAVARPPQNLPNAADKFVTSGPAAKPVMPNAAANDVAEAVADAGRAIGAVSDKMKALHAFEALGAVGRFSKFAKAGATKIPVAGVGIAAGLGAYALYHAEQGHNKGELTDFQINAVRGALLPYVGTQAGSFVTGTAGEEAIDAALIQAGVPKQYRLGTLREGIASGVLMLDEMNKRNARKAELPAPVVADFIGGMRGVNAATKDLALNDYFDARDKALTEAKLGRYMGVKVGTVRISPEETQAIIDNAARIYLAMGGSLETAQFALSENPEYARAQAMIQDVISLAPSRGNHAFPTADKNLEALKKLKQQGEARPADQPALMQQMVAAAAEYVKAGGTARDALVSYYHAAPFGLSPETVKQLEADKAMLKLMDGSDGTKANGKLTPMEIAQGLINLGVYNGKLDVDHDGVASYAEIKAAIRNPSEFQAQRNNPSSSRVR